MARILAWIAWGLILVACSPGPAPAQIHWIGRFEAVTGALSFTVSDPSAPDDSPLEIRLAELDTPVPDQTRAVLGDRLSGHRVGVAQGEGSADRYGRRLAHVYLLPDDAPSDVEPVWLQAWLVEAGAARVLSHADNRIETPRLLALEADARSQGRGLWADPALSVRDTHPDGLAQHVGSVQLVEGRVLEATRLRSGRIYLNFGADYRTDFTVMIEAADEPAFQAAGLDPVALETRRIRVRGWLEDQTGPMIRIDHPERIEILAD